MKDRDTKTVGHYLVVYTIHDTYAGVIDPLTITIYAWMGIWVTDMHLSRSTLTHSHMERDEDLLGINH